MREVEQRQSFDRTVSSLCAEIDDLHELVTYWKDRAEKAEREHSESLNSHLKTAQQGIADSLALFFAVQEDGNGNLVIPSENRAGLVEHFNPKN